MKFKVFKLDGPIELHSDYLLYYDLLPTISQRKDSFDATEKIMAVEFSLSDRTNEQDLHTYLAQGTDYQDFMVANGRKISFDKLEISNINGKNHATLYFKANGNNGLSDKQTYKVITDFARLYFGDNFDHTVQSVEQSPSTGSLFVKKRVMVPIDLQSIIGVVDKKDSNFLLELLSTETRYSSLLEKNGIKFNRFYENASTNNFEIWFDFTEQDPKHEAKILSFVSYYFSNGAATIYANKRNNISVNQLVHKDNDTQAPMSLIVDSSSFEDMEPKGILIVPDNFNSQQSNEENLKTPSDPGTRSSSFDGNDSEINAVIGVGGRDFQQSFRNALAKRSETFNQIRTKNVSPIKENSTNSKKHKSDDDSSKEGSKSSRKKQKIS